MHEREKRREKTEKELLNDLIAVSAGGASTAISGGRIREERAARRRKPTVSDLCHPVHLSALGITLYSLSFPFIPFFMLTHAQLFHPFWLFSLIMCACSLSQIIIIYYTLTGYILVKISSMFLNSFYLLIPSLFIHCLRVNLIFSYSCFLSVDSHFPIFPGLLPLRMHMQFNFFSLCQSLSFSLSHTHTRKHTPHSCLCSFIEEEKLTSDLSQRPSCLTIPIR